MTDHHDHEIHTGDWRTALAHVKQVDAVICDPPYGARTHAGSAGDAGIEGRSELGYDCWEPGDVAEFVGSWSPRCRGWMVALTSHDLIPAWESAYAAAGRYAFAPVPVHVRHIPRMAGDGPSSGWVHAVVARPRTKELASWGTLPSYYHVRNYKNAKAEKCDRTGGKPEWLMRALVRDYSRPGDLVCDPFAGAGTTLVAAALEGRRSIGAELEPEWAEHTRARLERVTAQTTLDFGAAIDDAKTKRTTGDLFDVATEDQ